MSKKASDFQKKVMSRIYRGKEIFKPLNQCRKIQYDQKALELKVKMPKGMIGYGRTPLPEGQRESSCGSKLI